MTHPFPFIGAGVAAARKTMTVLVVFEGPVAKTKRKAIAKGLPASLADTSWDIDRLTVAHDDDSLSWAVCAEFESADPDYFGETASHAQWEAFNAVFNRWLLAIHAVVPIRFVVRPIDDEYGTATSAWHDWSVARANTIERATLPDWAADEVARARPTPKPKKPASKPTNKPKATSPAKLADAIWNMSYMPDPLVAAMTHHRERDEPELEAAAFWGGVLYMPRLFPRQIDRERSKAIGRPPPDAADRFARLLRRWIGAKLAKPSELSLDDVFRWLGWCCKIQSAELDDWHQLLEREVIAREQAGNALTTKDAFCPLCGKLLAVQYAGDVLVTAVCSATGARMSMSTGVYFHRNMFDAAPTGPAFNAMRVAEPDWFCARCGTKHQSRKRGDNYTVQLRCHRCKHGYTSGLLDGLFKSMHDRHYR